jgi:hypothetical protein
MPEHQGVENNGNIAKRAISRYYDFLEWTQNNIFNGGSSSTLLLYVDNVNSINLNLDYNLYNGNPSANIEYGGTAYASLDSYKSGTSQDSHSSFQDPIFRSIINQDYHLASSSPAQNMGNPISSAVHGTNDYDYESRLLDNRIDIGADEYVVWPLTLSLARDMLFSNSYSAVPEIVSFASIGQGGIVNLLAPEVTLNEYSIIAENSTLTILTESCR